MRSFFRKHRRTWRVLLTLVAAVVLFDGVVAVLAWREVRSHRGEDEPWFVTSCEFEPSAGLRDRSVVLLHGFGGSPFDMKPLVEPLRNAGFRVVAPLMPGQSKCAGVYARGSFTPDFFEDWLTGILKAEKERSGRKPFLVGFSMGGTLSILAAARGRAERVVLLAPFLGLPTANGLLRTVTPAVAFIVPVIPKLAKGRINDPEGKKDYEPGSHFVSLRAFTRLSELANRARSAAPEIQAPTLVLSAQNDQVASFTAITETFASHPAATLRLYPRSNHILLYDHDRAEVVKDVIEFLSR